MSTWSSTRQLDGGGLGLPAGLGLGPGRLADDGVSSGRHELAVMLTQHSSDDARLITEALERAGFDVHARRVQNAAEMAAALEQGRWDIILCDHVLPRFDSLAALELLADLGSTVPLVVVSGAVGEEAAAAAIRHGAADFVSKDHLSGLAPVVLNILRDAHLRENQRRAEAQFRSAFDDAPFGTALIGLDPDAGRIRRVNRALCEATAYAENQLLELHVQKLLAPDEREHFDRGLRALSEGRTRIFRTETRLVDAAGTQSWFLCSLSNVGAPGGRDAVAHFVDIDARRRVEEALQLAHSQAIEASRLKSEFVVNMSHELRTPLNGVVGLAGLLAESDLSPDQRAYAAGIRTSGQALMGVIGGILDFSKIESGALTIEPGDFEPAEVVAQVCALVAPTVKEKALNLSAKVDAAVPDTVRADGGRVRQVLTNLVGNSVKFTDSGTIEIGLSIEPARRRMLRFDVTDSGPGLEANARPFEPFWQADASMARHHGGTGLGLAIAERMVELMGGAINVESAPDGGSHFWFSVPYEDAALADDNARDLDDVHALLCDSDANRVAILSRQLESLGAQLTRVDGRDALLAEIRAAEGNAAYDVILLVETDGDDTAEVIRREFPAAARRVLALASAPVLASESAAAPSAGRLAGPFGRSRLSYEIGRIVGANAPASDEEAGARGLLLLVEDDATNRLFAVDMLKRHGWGVEVAVDGVEGVAMAEAGRYDAILMDCQMQRLDGYGATREIRRREGAGRHVPIIAVTAHATALERQRCLRAGMNGYVAKPFTPDDIEDALRREIGRGRSPQPAAAPQRRASAPAAPEAVLDRDRLEQTDDQVRTELIDLFIRTAHRRVAQLAAATAAGDDRTALHVAHTLKGAAATIGAFRLKEACEDLRGAIVSGEADRIQAGQLELDNVLVLTEEALVS